MSGLSWRKSGACQLEQTHFVALSLSFLLCKMYLTKASHAKNRWANASHREGESKANEQVSEHRGIWDGGWREAPPQSPGR